MRSLVIQTSFLGDVVLTTPLLVELAGRGSVDVVVGPGGAQILAGHPAVRSVIVYDKRRTHAGLTGLWRLAKTLRGQYDAAFLAQSSIRSALIAWGAGIPMRVGLAGGAGRRLYTHRVPAPKNVHHAERLWRLAFPVGDRPDEMPAPLLVPGPDERRAVDALIGESAPPSAEGAPLIALAPGSVWATKRWPYFEQLAVRLAADWRLVVVGGDDDHALGEIIRVRVPSAINAAGALTLLGSAELIRRARVIVTNDSSPTHLASAVGTPTVTIYGPTTPGFGFGPLAPGSRMVQHDAMPCSPCHHHGPVRCPLGHWKCMTELSVERVLEAIRVVAETALPRAR